MTTRKKKRGTADMTEFGKTLNELMVHHQLYEWQDLVARLNNIGYEIGQPRLSGYLYGDRNPRRPRELFEAIAKALDLSEPEKMKLIYSYGYPATNNGNGLSDETAERARAAEEEIKARKRARGGQQSSWKP